MKEKKIRGNLESKIEEITGIECHQEDREEEREGRGKRREREEKGEEREGRGKKRKKRKDDRW